MTQAEKSAAAIAKQEEKLATMRTKQEAREAKATKKQEEAGPKMRIALGQLEIRARKMGLTEIAKEIVAAW